ncbi:HPr-rel-A system PqqD family peptide chaperone [Massilia sp. CCM 8733]|uniref:HPr-rel-A system PqqD family peptide chaperone n=1 Tax=Massilia mucilaginosa TaxID=2609282 RepID=A0ABX0NX89_9BURK|nr:HPr-rel-A system PqqD family peptide chaperone [Massilia mucilaginosa]NHZ91379.1 HPr-rel-A system PqqD family peptide chaperone [Massilia mucilaginosa]
MPHAPSWHVLPGQRLHYRQWEQEAVLFNDLSGDTHLLDADALAVLLAVRDGAAGLAALRAALGAEDDAEGEADCALQALLEQLASIDLIEQRA